MILDYPRDMFLYAPNEPASGAPAAAAATESTVTPAAPQPETTPPAASSSTSAGGAPAAGATPSAAPASPSWLDSFKKDGFTTTETDEAKIRQQLLQSHRDAERLKPLAPALTTYQQHANEFHQWLADKQKQTQTQAQQDWTAKLGWNPPPYDPNWRTQLTTDAQGNIVPIAGAPHDLVPKYQAYQQFRNAQADKLLENPGKFMEPYIRHIAAEMAAQYTQQNVGQYREQQEAQSFINQHQDWLFDKGQDGKVKVNQVFNPATGRHDEQKALSAYGQLFVQALQEGAQGGMSPQAQQTYALKAVQNAYLASDAYRQQVISEANAAAAAGGANGKPKTTREAANQGFNDRANPAQPPAAGTQGGNSTPAPEKVTGQNLQEVMLKRFREAGVTGL